MKSCLVKVDESMKDKTLWRLQEQRRGTWRKVFGRLAWWLEHEPAFDGEALRWRFCTEIHRSARRSQ